MGIFGDSKVTTVATSVSRVIQDEALPNAVKTGVLGSIFEGGDIPEYIMEELLGSIGTKAERMYEYADKHYTHGLPQAQIHSAMQGKAEAQAVLNGIEGTPVLIDYCQYASPNYLHIAWTRLVAQYSYNPSTNELVSRSALKSQPVYLEDITIVVPASVFTASSPEEWVQWGTPAKAGSTPERDAGAFLNSLLAHTPVKSSTTATEIYAQIDCIWRGPGTVTTTEGTYHGTITHRETLHLSLEGFDREADYFHVKYSVNDVIKYWMYLAGSGTYPALDAAFDDPAKTTGDFFPMTYFRYAKQSTVTDKTTDDYKTSKKLVKYLGMDYDMVAEAIDENPDITDVEQAMMVFAVPANSKDPLELRYLYEFFNDWFDASPTQFATPAAGHIPINLGQPKELVKSAILIQDKRFKMALNNGGIYKKRVAGTIGPKGSYTNGVLTSTVEQEYEYGGGDSQGQMAIRRVPVKSHYYRYQITEYLYDEILVVNLKMVYHVWEKYTVTADDTDDILLIPLARTITSKYSTPDREILYARALHYVFNSRTTIKLKWYQTGLFQAIMIIVAVVVTVYTLGSDGGALLTAIVSGSSAAITAAAWVLIKKLILGFLIGQAFKLFVKAVGIELAFVAAIVAALYGGYQALKASSVANAPWASELLQLANGLSKAIQEVVGDLMKDLQSEISSFGKYVEDQYKLLETAQELLDTHHLLSPFVIFGESPNDFYNRTTHSGNIGVLGISAISSYVDIALTLPKLNDTLGEATYG